MMAKSGRLDVGIWNSKMSELQKATVTSLQSILTKEQICKFVVFEKKFRDEIRNVILDKKSSGHLKNSKTKD
jgi:hypothetical protein